jgi:isocitrate/isopropylmalate dehydrogenase
MSFEMMLKDLGMKEKADRLQDALREVIAQGKQTTADIGGHASTSAFTQAVKEKL